MLAIAGGIILAAVILLNLEAIIECVIELLTGAAVVGSILGAIYLLFIVTKYIGIPGEVIIDIAAVGMCGFVFLWLPFAWIRCAYRYINRRIVLAKIAALDQ
jgi:hypothetical protein